METLLWALEGGDVTSVATTLFLPAEALSKAEELLARLPPADAQKHTKPTIVAAFLIGVPVLDRQSAPTQRKPLLYQLLGEEPGIGLSPVAFGLNEVDKSNPNYKTVRVNSRRGDAPDAEISTAFYVMYRDGDEWKCVIPPSHVTSFIQKLKKPKSK